ncbi:hypothetical protein HNQ49_000690 [Parapusillimonas granuli]|uniref:Uncharacterized protein n=1 Tax=Parapusillimonas granuli TaxID=380911 RepID=A0A853FWN6_9BURK|nr:hypothetical protein [Parapusillimonas granuli]NYT50435.1 hypothetical protein [Parapusillimonas granuli]
MFGPNGWDKPASRDIPCPSVFQFLPEVVPADGERYQRFRACFTGGDASRIIKIANELFPEAALDGATERPAHARYLAIEDLAEKFSLFLHVIDEGFHL